MLKSKKLARQIMAAMSIGLLFTSIAWAKSEPVRPLDMLLLASNQALFQNPSNNEQANLPTAYDLSTLDTTPDPLAGIDGLHPTRVPLNAISPETLKTFVQVIDLVRRQYVIDVGDELLFRHAMQGMLDRLDSHAEFLDETALKNLRAFTEGNVASIGLTTKYSFDDGYWVVSHIIEDSPADKAGISLGDYLHEINGKKLGEMHDENDVSQMLSGIAGTQLDIVVSNAGRNKRPLTLQRNYSEEAKLHVSMEGGVAIVRLPVFTNRTRQDLMQWLARINVPIQAVIIDVRNNPGGVLSSAVDVASLFMSRRPVVQVVGRDNRSQLLSTDSHSPLIDMPVMILQNRYSASAAEVLAAAFKQNGAIVAGETSYGKGSVQSIIPLNNTQAIKITTAHYQMANGDKIDQVGVEPTLKLNFQDGMWLVDIINIMKNKQLPIGKLMSLSDDY